MFLNHDFYTQCDILGFINASIQELSHTNPTLLASNEYRLFYFIKENFASNLFSLHGINIDFECMGFPLLHRNTRHSIESYFDLINLCQDDDYLSVLKYCAKKGHHDPKFKKYKSGNIFSIRSKHKIATELYGLDPMKVLCDIAGNNNDYIHPNIFTDILTGSDINKKSEILKVLLGTNLFLLTSAYRTIIKKFNNNQQPILNCSQCQQFTLKNCLSCFNAEHTKFDTLVKNGLFTYTPPTSGYWPPYQNQ